jgi:hypothetical protein
VVVCGLVAEASSQQRWPVWPGCGFQQQAIIWFSQLPTSGNVGSVHGNRELFFLEGGRESRDGSVVCV